MLTRITTLEEDFLIAMFSGHYGCLSTGKERKGRGGIQTFFLRTVYSQIAGSCQIEYAR